MSSSLSTVIPSPKPHCANICRPPFISNDTALAAYIAEANQGISLSTVNYIVSVLYPPVYDGSYPYTNIYERTFLLVKEEIFSCNTHYLAEAYNNQTYNYQFEIPPAFHGFDVPYTFYNGGPPSTSIVGVADPPIAEVLQGYITNFAMTGNPNGPGLPVFPMQGTNSSMNGLNVTGVTQQVDDTANARCNWWQTAPI